MNSLPLEVRSACSVDKFKASAIRFVTNCNYYYSFKRVYCDFSLFLIFTR